MALVCEQFISKGCACSTIADLLFSLSVYAVQGSVYSCKTLPCIRLSANCWEVQSATNLLVKTRLHVEWPKKLRDRNIQALKCQSLARASEMIKPLSCEYCPERSGLTLVYPTAQLWVSKRSRCPKRQGTNSKSTDSMVC